MHANTTTSIPLTLKRFLITSLIEHRIHITLQFVEYLHYPTFFTNTYARARAPAPAPPPTAQYT
jgi:hypothetical protein